MHRSVGSKYVTQSLEPCIRVRKMMENPGADNLVKILSEFACPLDGELVELEIL
jgi:hypothetical protein